MFNSNHIFQVNIEITIALYIKKWPKIGVVTQVSTEKVEENRGVMVGNEFCNDTI